jgi:hypothetical protein
VTGAGFMPGVSGNPGGRPKGLSRRVRELVGDDGQAIAEYMFRVLSDETQRTADRMEAAKWLADRGFGKPLQALDIDVNAGYAFDISDLSTPDLEAIADVLRKYSQEAAELAEGGSFGLVQVPSGPRVTASGQDERGRSPEAGASAENSRSQHSGQKT